MEEEASSSQEQQLPLVSPRRKPSTKMKKKPIPKKKLAIINEKLSFLSKNLRPVHSLPSPKTLADFVLPHEPLFRSLGLWDFAHLPFSDPSSPLRRDLLAELIARFDPSDRCSYVRDARVNVSRADLARALSLPVRKEKPEPSAAAAPLDDAVQGALLGFMSNAMVFLEDAAEVPGEVVQAQRMVREGRVGWVDWAGLVWAMVEKEMVEAPKTGPCYYASHLQCLIRFQKPKLFEVEVEVEVEEDPPVVAKECNAEASSGSGLNMGIGAADNKNGTDGVFATGIEEGAALSRGEEGEVEMEDGFHDELASKFPPLGRLNSMDLMQAIGNHNSLSFNLEQSNGDFLGMGSEGSSLLFADDHKRRIDEIGNGEDGSIHGFHQSNHHDHQQQQEKFRSYTPWEHTQSVLAFDGCIGDVRSLMRNARMVLVAKERAFANARQQVLCLNGILQQKEEIIRSLERNMLQERQKRHIEACKLEHELRTLSNVLFYYKKAMKDTRSAFAEYRKTKFPPYVEPVLNNGGGVEQMRKVAVGMIDDFQENWMGRLAAYGTQVSESAERLVELHGEAKILKGKLEEAEDHRNCCDRPVGLGKIAKLINAGHIDSSELITMKTLKETGAIGKQIKDGVRLMGRGSELIKWPIHLEVTRVTVRAKAAVEAFGGSVRKVFYNKLGLRALLKPEWFAKKRRLLPKPARPPPKLQDKVDSIGRLPAPTKPIPFERKEEDTSATQIAS